MARWLYCPAVRCKGFLSTWYVMGLASMYLASRWSVAPGHHGYQRACDLIRRQASSKPFTLPHLLDTCTARLSAECDLPTSRGFSGQPATRCNLISRGLLATRETFSQARGVGKALASSFWSGILWWRSGLNRLKPITTGATPAPDAHLAQVSTSG
jgi:hypothetical protein